MKSSSSPKTVGTICYATEQGLGYLVKSFFDNGIINKVSLHAHTSRTNHREWYPRESIVSQEELLETCGTLFFFETPFNWKIIPQAREKNIKTILMPMYECTNFPNPYQADLIVSPSLLDKDYYPDSIFIPVPVDVPWKLRTKARVFVHNAGNGGIGGRNGTKELIEAMEYVKSPIKLIIRSQVPIHATDPRIEVRIGTFDDIWSEGDVFIFPEKFNGLSLPLQEAYASGMLVMGSNRYPMNTWLPTEPLIPVSGYTKERICTNFDSAIIDPREIAKMIDLWYDADITDYSLMGKQYANDNSWESLKDKYLNIL